MKKYLVYVIIILVIALIAALKQSSYANKEWETAVANMKAYSEQLQLAKKENTAFKLNIEQLEYFQDSIIKDLNDTRKELGIKDKDLKALQKLSSTFVKTDTLRLRDTLYRDPSLSIDTLLGDKWYSLHVNMKYPSTLAITPEFKSEKNIVLFSRKETVNPPKKFFLLRWFQKKHTVLKINVIEKNPYIKDENNCFIEILE